ncbi:MAG: hypothetical protein KBT21_01265 [Treponema sp.]|nr:hypothetical protein [Candidatus Treponema merdequi]
MKNFSSKHLFILTASAVLLSSTLSAQTFEDFGDFGTDFGGETKQGVTVSGRASLETRAYCDTDTSDKVEMQAIPDARLGFSFNGKQSDVNVVVHLDEYTIKNHPIDVLDEATLRGYFGNFQIEAGIMKIVWGKGDKNHVIDNFNADDYHDFVIPDYIDRRVSTPMIRAKYNFPVNNLCLEGVYTPFLPVDRFAVNGKWVPGQVTQLKSLITSNASNAVVTAAYKAKMDNSSTAPLTTAAYLTALTQANNLNSNQDIIYPDMKTLKYGQYGGRLTGTFGPIDLGISYYNGYYKQPSVNAAKMSSYLTKYLSEASISEDEKFLAYDKKQTFGIEAAAAIWHFNIRGEACYNLTEDIEGTNPWIHNNSIAWLGGFDIDLPFWNMNLNIQETGTYILNRDKIRNNITDIEKSKNNNYAENKLIANISTSFVNDKLVPEVTFIWVIENNDFVILPKITYSISDGLSLYASGMYITSTEEASQFYSWRNNSFVSLGATYRF